jgi:riboflavin synthase
MFTGIVSELGTVDAVESSADGARLRVRADVASELGEGDSVAVNGACLTATSVADGAFETDVMHQTLELTTLGELESGSRANLELPLRADDRLGGHLVQGHVDDVADVVAVRRERDAMLVDLALSPKLEQLMVPHGSVAVDGVSLTVNALPAPGILQLSLIEYTWTHTTLGALRPGDGVHVEADMIGKYVRQLVAPYAAAR